MLRICTLALLLASSAQAATIPTSAYSNRFTLSASVPLDSLPPIGGWQGQPLLFPQQAETPWSASVTGSVDTTSLVWTRQNLAYDPLPTEPLVLTSNPVDLTAIYHTVPSGFDPPVPDTFATLDDATISLVWVWAETPLALPVPQQILLDPLTLSATISSEPFVIGQLHKHYNGSQNPDVLAPQASAIANFSIECDRATVTCSSRISLQATSIIQGPLYTHADAVNFFTPLPTGVRGIAGFDDRIYYNVTAQTPEPSAAALLLGALTLLSASRTSRRDRPVERSSHPRT